MWFDLIAVLVSVVLVLVVVWLSYKKKNAYLLSVFIIPVLIYILANQVDGFFNFSWFLFIISVISIIVFPLIFLSKEFDKNTGLLLFLALLIMWDWAVTWVYVNNYSIEELNVMLNVGSFMIFSMQKLSPVLLFGIMFLIAKGEDKLLGKLNLGLGVVAVAYYGVFSWQLWVVSLMNKWVISLLMLALITGLYVVFVLLKRRFLNIKYLNS